jgi:anaerobic selenocysteine-containing dehydrogenase
MNDRYRGITGRRDVVFVNERDLSSRGLKHGDLVDIASFQVRNRNRASVLCGT